MSTPDGPFGEFHVGFNINQTNSNIGFHTPTFEFSISKAGTIKFEIGFDGESWFPLVEKRVYLGAVEALVPIQIQGTT